MHIDSKVDLWLITLLTHNPCSPFTTEEALHVQTSDDTAGGCLVGMLCTGVNASVQVWIGKGSFETNV